MSIILQVVSSWTKIQLILPQIEVIFCVDHIYKFRPRLLILIFHFQLGKPRTYITLNTYGYIFQHTSQNMSFINFSPLIEFFIFNSSIVKMK